MYTSALHIPQWQGTASARNYQEGAGISRTLVEKLMTGRVRDVAIPADEPMFLKHGVLGHDALVRNFAAIQKAMRKCEGPVFTIGGDCSVDYVPIAEVLKRHNGEVGLVWIDTHPDLNVPASSVSRHFHGMIVRALLGEAPSPELQAFVPTLLPVKNLFYVAPHDIDPGEVQYLRDKGVFVLDVAHTRVGNVEPLLAAIRAAGLSKVHLHLDLDVIDPDIFPHVATPVPEGVTPENVVTVLQTLRNNFEVVGGAMTEISPNPHFNADNIAMLLHILTQGFGFTPVKAERAA